MAGILTTTPPASADREPPSPVAPVHRWIRRIALVIAGVLVFMLIAWVLDDPVENLSTDWTAFDNAADRVLAGEDVYRPYDATSEPLPYLYPPFALWLALPLGIFGFTASFVFSALLSAGCLVFGLVWMSRAETGTADRSRIAERTTALIVGLGSGAAITSTLIGQYSGVYALAIGGAARAYSTDRRTLAGVFLALLWLKPNLAIAVPVVVVWSRSWVVLRGFAIASAGIFVSSVPFGLDQWNGFSSNVQMMAELQETGVVPFRKMVTILGSAQTLLDVNTTEPGLIVFWLGSTGLLGIAVLQLWRREALEESPMRAFGALALFVVAANPRLYFYDATLVVVGSLGIWLSSTRFGGATARRFLAVLMFASWISLWGGVFVALNTLVGPLAGLTLVVVSLDHWFRTKSQGQVAPVNGPSGL